MRGALRPQRASGVRPGFAGFGGIQQGLGSDPCAENFWSAACWFGTSGSQALGVDPGAATIKVTPPPTSACAGTIGVDANGKWTCTQVASPNDSNNTQGQLATNGEDFQKAWQDWIDSTTASANVPQLNTAEGGIGSNLSNLLTGSSPFWLIGIAAAAIFIFSKGGR